MSVDFSKRYWLFEWADYYPGGALDNVVNVTDDLKIALEWAISEPPIYENRCSWDNKNYCYLPEKTFESEANERFKLIEEKINALMDAFNAVSGAQLTTLIDSLDAKINDIKIRSHTLGEKLSQLATKTDMLDSVVDIKKNSMKIP